MLQFFFQDSLQFSCWTVIDEGQVLSAFDFPIWTQESFTQHPPTNSHSSLVYRWYLFQGLVNRLPFFKIYCPNSCREPSGDPSLPNDHNYFFLSKLFGVLNDYRIDFLNTFCKWYNISIVVRPWSYKIRRRNLSFFLPTNSIQNPLKAAFLWCQDVARLEINFTGFF